MVSAVGAFSVSWGTGARIWWLGSDSVAWGFLLFVAWRRGSDLAVGVFFRAVPGFGDGLFPALPGRGARI